MSARTLSPRGRRGTAVFTAGLIAVSTFCAPLADAAPSSPDTTARLNALAADAIQAGVPSVIVRVDNGHGPVVKIAKQAPWTVADHEIGTNDAFRFASNTKTMVGTLVLQLVAEHRVGLDDTVEKWLPGLVPNGQAITLRMLLNHTSGLPDYVLASAFLGTLTGQQPRTWTPEELLAVFAGQDPLFAPGESGKWSYSNTNYIALGLVLEKATGRTLAQLIEHRITEPLGMDDTYLSTSASWRGRGPHVRGYEPDAAHLAPLLPEGTPAGFSFAGPTRGEHVDTTAIDPSWAWANGGIVSTPTDWSRFLSALAGGELLPPAQLRQMRESVPEQSTDPDGRSYGLGLEKVPTPCGTVWGHTGGLPGYTSENYTDRTGDRTVTVLIGSDFGLLDPAAGAVGQKLVASAICAMFDKRWP